MKVSCIKQLSLLLLFPLFLAGCVFIPKVAPENNQGCQLVTKGLTLDVYTSPETIESSIEEMSHVIQSGCNKPECLIILMPTVALSVGSFIVSGSIVVVGNTIHWIEKQGACDDSVTQQTVSKLINSTKELGGWVVKTGDEFIDWLKKQVSEPEETGA
jgi:hypothetical protein